MTYENPSNSLRTVAQVLVLFALVVAGGIPVQGVAAAALDDAPTECADVVYDEFRTDDTVVDELVNTTSATVTKQNTRVAINKENGFLRVTGENPNGYCMTFTVEVHQQVFPPAKLPGDVTSNSGNYTATWTSVYDWENETVYTRIQFTLKPDTSATFAPSKARVYSINWATEAPSKANSVIEKAMPEFFDDQVTKSEYILNASDFNQSVPFPVTIPLRHPQTGEPVKGAIYLYSTDGGETWRRVPTRTTAPVYREPTGNGTGVQLHFNDKDVKVKMIVNPGPVQAQMASLSTYETTWKMTVNSLVPGEVFTVTRTNQKQNS